MTDRKELSLYIHIPFCVRKCLYCDFLSFPVTEMDYVNQTAATDIKKRNVARDNKYYVNTKGNRGDSLQAAVQSQIENYVNLICREIAARAPQFQKYRVISIFFGGGTPSLLPAEELGRIMDAVKTSFALTEDVEITVECNPGTVTADKLRYYITHGINRLSIGLQSTEDEELARIGRIHDYEAFLETYRLARETGFCNINVDLMAALPGQTKASYQRTLERVCALLPEHISAYSLILEEGTPLYRNRKDYVFPDEEEERELYYMTERMLLNAGYHRYEISNYARKDRECRHNKVYWRRGDYLGLGLGASSLIADVRWKNPQEMSAYRTCVDKTQRAAEESSAKERPLGPQKNLSMQEGTAGTKETAESLWESGLQEVQVLSRQEQMEEYMFLGLRMAEGVEEAGFLRAFGVSLDAVYGEIVARLTEQGLLVRAGGRLFLTPRGIDVSNVVFAEFLL